MKRRIFLDTAFLLAVINRSDEYHFSAAKYYRALVEQKWLLVTTEAILIEVGNSLAKQRTRMATYQWLNRIRQRDATFTVVPLTNALFRSGNGTLWVTA
jgi:predicted nucleic acid-binding protein